MSTCEEVVHPEVEVPSDSDESKSVHVSIPLEEQHVQEVRVVEKSSPKASIFKHTSAKLSTKADLTSTLKSKAEPIYSEDAQLVLSKTINAMNWVLVSGLFASFSYSSRFAIWYLYAREFDDATEHGIALVLWAGIFSLAIVGSFYSCLGDVIGYDVALMVKLIIRCIGIFCECIATNFVFLSVFYVISQVQIAGISLAYIAWILPPDEAVKYTNYYYSGFAIFYITGPIFAGILSHFMTYRAVFWVNLILNIITLIFAFVFISNQQRTLEAQQLTLKDEFEKSNTDKKHVFPIIHHSDVDRGAFATFWSSLSCFEWFQLVNVVLQNSLTMTVEPLLVAYYAVFVVDNFDGNPITGTLGVFGLALGFIIGNASIPSVLGNENLMPAFNKVDFIIIGSSVIMIILLIVLFPMITNPNLFWIISIFIGLFLGMTVMSQEALILQHQPTEHAGKVGGIKEATRQGVASMAVLITGMLYSQNINYAFVYVSGVCYCISLLLSIIHATNASKR
eukprot:878868_1